MNEIKSLTGIRGVAALWVVMLHFVYVVNYHTDNVFLDAGNQFLKKGNMGVDMFFMLSAFVMSLAYQSVFNIRLSLSDIKKYLLKRFIRIYPAYAFWLLLTALVYKKWSLTTIGVNLILSQNFFNPDKYIIGGIFWSLCAEWWMYMIFPFVYFILNKFFSKKGLFIVLIIVASFIGLYLLPTFNIIYIEDMAFSMKEYDNQFSVILGINSVVRCFLCYLIGIAIFLIVNNNYIIQPEKFLGPKSVYFIFGIILLLSFFRNTEIFIAICFAILIVALYINRNVDTIFSSRIIYFLGLISYSVYLLHTTLRFIITVIMMKIYNIPVQSADMPSMILAAIVLIPISYLSYTFVEKRTGLWLKFKFKNALDKDENILAITRRL